MSVFSFSPVQFFWGAAFALAAALLALRFKLLSKSGALGAFLLGWAVFGLGGLPWAAVLLSFFLTSSGWSLVFKKRKKTSEKMYAKGSRRDAGQVLANGSLAGGFVLLHVLLPGSPIPWIGFCAALAAANADTWATELGVLDRRAPVMITNGKKAEAGTSGAVSLTGILAAAAGAALIAAVGAFCIPAGVWQGSIVQLFLLISLSGLVGSLVDSVLGATLQAIYYCPACQKETEKHPLHGCGTETIFLRGLSWLNNDGVNLACTLSSALMALFLWLI